MSPFEWYGDLPWYVRYSVAGAFLLSSTYLLLAHGRFWPWGWAVGIVLLIFGGPSDSEKKGYNF